MTDSHVAQLVDNDVKGLSPTLPPKRDSPLAIAGYDDTSTLERLQNLEARSLHPTLLSDNAVCDPAISVVDISNNTDSISQLPENNTESSSQLPENNTDLSSTPKLNLEKSPPDSTQNREDLDEKTKLKCTGSSPLLQTKESDNFNSKKRTSSPLLHFSSKKMRHESSPAAKWTPRNIEHIHKNLRLNVEMRQAALSRFYQPFKWTRSAQLRFKCCGKTVPPQMLKKFQKFLHVKGMTHPVYYPTLTKVEDSESDLFTAGKPSVDVYDLEEMDSIPADDDDAIVIHDSSQPVREMQYVDRTDTIKGRPSTPAEEQCLPCPICNNIFAMNILESHAMKCASRTYRD